MEALRLIVTPHQRRLIIDLPEALAAGNCEVIVLPAPASERALSQIRRPSKRLLGTLITGDLQAPAVSAEDWDALA